MLSMSEVNHARATAVCGAPPACRRRGAVPPLEAGCRGGARARADNQRVPAAGPRLLGSPGAFAFYEGRRRCTTLYVEGRPAGASRAGLVLPHETHGDAERRGRARMWWSSDYTCLSMLACGIGALRHTSETAVVTTPSCVRSGMLTKRNHTCQPMLAGLVVRCGAGGRGRRIVSAGS